MDIDEFLDNELNKNSGGQSRVIEPSNNDYGVSGSEAELFSQINSVKDLLHNKHNLESANKMFFSLKDKYVAIAKKQKQENKYIVQELEEMNKEIIDLINQEKEKLNKKIILIMELLHGAQELLKNKEIGKANKAYIEIKELIKQIPDLFIEKKRKVQNQALSFYIQLTEEIDKISFISLKKRTNEINNLIKIAYQSLQTGRKEVSEDSYKKINIEYNRLPEGFADEKIRIYSAILHLFKCIYLGETIPANFRHTEHTNPMAQIAATDPNQGSLEIPKLSPTTEKPTKQPSNRVSTPQNKPVQLNNQVSNNPVQRMQSTQKQSIQQTKTNSSPQVATRQNTVPVANRQGHPMPTIPTVHNVHNVQPVTQQKQRPINSQPQQGQSIPRRIPVVNNPNQRRQ